MCLFSMSVLQIRSSISFFSYIPHVCVNIWYLFFSFWLHSVWQSLCPSTSLQRTQFHPFLLLRNIPLYICTTSSFSTPLSRHLSCFRVLALVNSAGLGCMCLFEVCFSLVYDQSWDWWVGKRICLQCSRCRRQGLNPWVRRAPEQGPDNLLQYSCLENPMARGAWRATAYMVTKSWTWLKWLSTQHMAVLCLIFYGSTYDFGERETCSLQKSLYNIYIKKKKVCLLICEKHFQEILLDKYCCWNKVRHTWS